MKGTTEWEQNFLFIIHTKLSFSTALNDSFP